MLVTLTSADRPELEAFLLEHVDSSLFLLSNVFRSGLADGGERIQGSYVAWVEQGRIVAVAAHVRMGNVLLQAPQRAAEVSVAAVAASGRPVTGILGPASQVKSARAALGMLDRPTALDGIEDLFSLWLSDLRMPPQLAFDWSCRVARLDELEKLSGWRHDYEVEALGATAGAELLRRSREDLAHSIPDQSRFVLIHRDEPVAMCAFNARIPSCVQIGGVWTPPALRGRGYGGAVVAGALALARGEGTQRSVLFTAVDNVPARRAYERIGYRRVGDYALLLFV